MKFTRLAMIAALAIGWIACFKPESANRPAPAQQPSKPTPERKPIEPATVGFDAALAAYRAGDLDKAEGLFKELAAAEPKNADAHFYLGKITVDRGKPEEALPHLVQASKLDVRSVEKLMTLGDLYFGLKRYENAIVEYGKIPGFEPEKAEAYYKMGRTYVALGNKIAARQQLKKVESLDKELARKLKSEIGD